MDIDRLCFLLFFEDIYRVMAVNQVKKIVMPNSKKHKIPIQVFLIHF
jgi:hypothetical protein